MVQKIFYTKYCKGAIDRILSILGLLLLSWRFLILSIVTYMDDPSLKTLTVLERKLHYLHLLGERLIP